jgi:uncharacterized protein YjdB
VTSISITYLGSSISEFTLFASQPIDLNASVYPLEVASEVTVNWRSSNENMCTVDEDGVVTYVGAETGWCEVIAECGGVAASCRVLVR